MIDEAKLQARKKFLLEKSEIQSRVAKKTKTLQDKKQLRNQLKKQAQVMKKLENRNLRNP